MTKRLTFRYIKDLSGNKRRYPKDPNFVAAFKSEDDKQHYIYALCTKSDFSTPDLFSASKDDYNDMIEFFKTTFDTEIAENIIDSVNDVIAIIELSREKYKIESRTIGEILNLK